MTLVLGEAAPYSELLVGGQRELQAWFPNRTHPANGCRPSALFHGLGTDSPGGKEEVGTNTSAQRGLLPPGDVVDDVADVDDVAYVNVRRLGRFRAAGRAALFPGQVRNDCPHPQRYLRRASPVGLRE